jgi:hypothetical protein
MASGVVLFSPSPKATPSMSDFEITACHANRAGKASVTLKHTPTGATVAIHNVPFDHSYSESSVAQCDRIQSTAAAIGDAALAFLKSQVIRTEIKPESHPGAAPDDSQPPERFGQTNTPA